MCEKFEELLKSDAIENRSGCVAIITKDRNGNCIDEVGLTMNYCPFCGKEIKSTYLKEEGHWTWWHA